MTKSFDKLKNKIYNKYRKLKQAIMRIFNKTGVKPKVRNTNRELLTILVVAFLAMVMAACPGGSPTDVSDETAATVNGTPIMLQEVERAIKSAGQGEESKMSPMELAQARLQVLQQLIQQEVMYQKAQKEQTIPTDEEVKAELNKRITGSGLSKEAFQEKLKAAGQTEATLNESLKKELATQKLVEKITGKVEAPSDAEITGFFNGNKEYFVRKRGVELAAIVVDPANSGQGDQTTNEAESIQRIKEIGQQLRSVDFAAVAREKSEDQSAIRGGDLGNVSEEELNRTFSPEIASQFMNEGTEIGSIAGPFTINGKYYIIKLKDRILKDEVLTLESPGVKKEITDTLVNNRKQLLAASYQAVAMNEAKIVNFLAQKVIDNPNELSGARPVEPQSKEAAPSDANEASEANSITGNAANGGNTNSAADNGQDPASAAKPGDTAPGSSDAKAGSADKAESKN